MDFCSEALIVSKEWSYAMVKNNHVYSLFDHANLTKKQEAHLVFDKILLRRHKYQRGKTSISPKLWMFKYKTKRRLLARVGKFTASKPRDKVLTIHLTTPKLVSVSMYEELPSQVTSLELKKLEFISSKELLPSISIVETFGDEDMVVSQSDLQMLGEANIATVDFAQLLRWDDATLMNSAIRESVASLGT